MPDRNAALAAEHVAAEVVATARELLPGIVALRRRLHAIPEIGLHLPDTQAALRAELEPLGLRMRTGTGLSSLVAVLPAPHPGPTVLLRADMDALPVTEDSTADYRSTRPGAMHACGHDAHMAMLVGAARLLADQRDRLAGDVVLTFQPGEEAHGGAALMLAEGLLDGLTDPRAYALHTTPSLAPGTLGVRAGTLFASMDTVRITVTGPGGHGATPHRGADTILAASAFCVEAQAVLSRVTDPLDPVVFTAGRIAGGSAPAVIPTEVVIEGTLRAVTSAGRDTARAALDRVARAVADAYGVTVACGLSSGYRPTVNDPGAVDTVRSAATALVTAGATLAATPRPVLTTLERPVMAAEDFGAILHRVPGAMVLLGTRTSPDAAANHSPRLEVDEQSLWIGTAVLALLALTAHPALHRPLQTVMGLPWDVGRVES